MPFRSIDDKKAHNSSHYRKNKKKSLSPASIAKKEAASKAKKRARQDRRNAKDRVNRQAMSRNSKNNELTEKEFFEKTLEIQKMEIEVSKGYRDDLRDHGDTLKEANKAFNEASEHRRKERENATPSRFKQTLELESSEDESFAEDSFAEESAEEEESPPKPKPKPMSATPKRTTRATTTRAASTRKVLFEMDVKSSSKKKQPAKTPSTKKQPAKTLKTTQPARSSTNTKKKVVVDLDDEVNPEFEVHDRKGQLYNMKDINAVEELCLDYYYSDGFDKEYLCVLKAFGDHFNFSQAEINNIRKVLPVYAKKLAEKRA